MSALLFAFIVAITSQVSGGAGRYGNAPPARDPAAEFGGLFAEEPATPLPAKAATSPAAGNGATNDATVGTPALPERATAAPTTTGTTPFPPTNRSGLSGNASRESVYGNVTVPPAAAQPINRRSAAEPTELIKAILTKPSDSQLTGTPIGLSEVVQGADSRSEQSERIEAYWDLCSAAADYYLGLIEQRELAHLERQQPAMGAALRQADTELRARVATAQRSARAAQLRLASLMGRSLTSELPLPKDTPHCGEYITRYEDKFGKSSAPEAAELHALLPLRHVEIESAAQAVARSEQWVHSVASSGATDNTGILRALELLALHRRAFVQLTRDYNRKITRYTELATPGRLATGRLVAMLIRTADAPAVAQRTAEPSRSVPRGEVPPATVPQTFITPPATSF